MIELTIITWVLLIFGWIFIFLPMVIVQLLVVNDHTSQKAKDIIIGKGEEYRDKTHSRMSLGIGWADLIIWLPFLLIGSIGVLFGQAWGYALWMVSGSISVYINIILWFSEKEYVYPSNGPLRYYTYLWGFFMFWGLAIIVYSNLRLIGIKV